MEVGGLEQESIEYKEYGYPVGFLCIACLWDADDAYCKMCANTCREPIPFSEVWGL